MRWVGHIAWTGVKENAYKFVMDNLKVRVLGRCGNRWKCDGKNGS